MSFSYFNTLNNIVKVPQSESGINTSIQQYNKTVEVLETGTFMHTPFDNVNVLAVDLEPIESNGRDVVIEQHDAILHVSEN